VSDINNEASGRLGLLLSIRLVTEWTDPSAGVDVLLIHLIIEIETYGTDMDIYFSWGYTHIRLFELGNEIVEMDVIKYFITYIPSQN